MAQTPTLQAPAIMRPPVTGPSARVRRPISFAGTYSATAIACRNPQAHTRLMTWFSKQCAVLLAFCGAAALPVRADEIRLKDGKKLNGVIVGYEQNMFRVKTDFGYVLVEKDKIASIIPSTEAQPAPGPAADAAKAASPKTDSTIDVSAKSAVAGAKAEKPVARIAS